jgi:hypothetical protein
VVRRDNSPQRRGGLRGSTEEIIFEIAGEAGGVFDVMRSLTCR